VGVRYFLMRDMGLWLGIDVACGPEDWYTVYYGGAGLEHVIVLP